MHRSKKTVSRSKKLIALLVAAFTLGNFLFLFPIYASGSSTMQTQTQIQMPSPTGMSASFCIPIPFIFPCKSPTPTPTPAPGKCIPIPIVHPCKSPTPTPTKTPPASGSPVATAPPSSPPQLSVNGSFTLTATEIVGTNAHLNISDALHPVLSFSSVTIEGMKLTHLSIILSASGIVTGSGVAIKTSVFKDLVTALSSFTDKADLLKLLVGATVKTLTMKNVRLQVDRYVQMQSLTVNGLTVG